ncbi:Uncharacterized protein HZ326_0903 [Fusarium oxysporum f. sp. albedinis]|nr:Uncharacterized protein HZ326_0903 [Fusarium oxysporum f. sp. albedinis]
MLCCLMRASRLASSAPCPVRYGLVMVSPLPWISYLTLTTRFSLSLPGSSPHATPTFKSTPPKMPWIFKLDSTSSNLPSLSLSLILFYSHITELLSHSRSSF